MSRFDRTELREARENLAAYQRRFSMPDSAMHQALGIAVQCIDAEIARLAEPELARLAERRQLTIDDITTRDND